MYVIELHAFISHRSSCPYQTAGSDKYNDVNCADVVGRIVRSEFDRLCIVEHWVHNVMLST